MRVVVCLLGLTLSGCLHISQPLEIAPDTYAVAGKGFGGFMGEETQRDAIEAARQFCAKRQKHFALLSATPTANYGVVEGRRVTLRCLSDADPESARSNGQQ